MSTQGPPDVERERCYRAADRGASLRRILLQAVISVADSPPVMRLFKFDEAELQAQAVLARIELGLSPKWATADGPPRVLPTARDIRMEDRL